MFIQSIKISLRLFVHNQESSYSPTYQISDNLFLIIYQFLYQKIKYCGFPNHRCSHSLLRCFCCCFFSLCLNYSIFNCGSSLHYSPWGMMFLARPTLMNASTARCTCSGVWLADSCTRIRACPFGTTGKENPTTKIPISSISSENSEAKRASPSMTGL